MSVKPSCPKLSGNFCQGSDASAARGNERYPVYFGPTLPSSQWRCNLHFKGFLSSQFHSDSKERFRNCHKIQTHLVCLGWSPGLWYLETPSWRHCQSKNSPKQQQSKVLGSFKLVLLLPHKMLKNSSFERRIRVLKSWLIRELDSMESFRCQTDSIPGNTARRATILGTWSFNWAAWVIGRQVIKEEGQF